jgi:hypothetical protein
MKTKNLLFIGLFALIFSSCATTNVAFNNNPDYHTKIKTAFLQVKDVQLGFFLKGLTDSLVNNLENNNVKVEIAKINILSLESETDVQNRLQTFNPDVIILLERVDKNMVSGKYGTFYSGGIYAMSIKIPEKDKIIWKASISTEGELRGDGSTKIIKETIQQIIARMKLDQLL